MWWQARRQPPTPCRRNLAAIPGSDGLRSDAHVSSWRVGGYATPARGASLVASLAFPCSRFRTRSLLRTPRVADRGVDPQSLERLAQACSTSTILADALQKK